jgi:hypothetical protein
MKRDQRASRLPWTRLCAAVLCAVIAFIAPPAAGRQDEAEEPPTLDELLGLEEEPSDRQAADVAEQQAERELQRRLGLQQMRSAFDAALEKMFLSADLLEHELDPGAATQRVQEEILIKLDQLIDEARKQCRGSCSSSSNSMANRPNQRPGAKPGGASKPGQPAGSRPGGAEPPLEQGDLNTRLEETGSEWGNLPQRVREMLLEGRSERFSTLYERLTREYYRRLAEESSS